jgi:hypothetical protein
MDNDFTSEADYDWLVYTWFGNLARVQVLRRDFSIWSI